MPKIYRCSLEVRGYELDSFGHVNHAVYLNYLEHARWRVLQDEGITLDKINAWKRWPVIAEIQISYLRPTFMGDLLEVRTQIAQEGRVSFKFEQSIHRGEDQVAKATIHSVIVNEKGRPADPPEELARLWKEEAP